jgi:hypothetical protein
MAAIAHNQPGKLCSPAILIVAATLNNLFTTQTRASVAVR